MFSGRRLDSHSFIQIKTANNTLVIFLNNKVCSSYWGISLVSWAPSEQTSFDDLICVIWQAQPFKTGLQYQKFVQENSLLPTTTRTAGMGHQQAITVVTWWWLAISLDWCRGAECTLYLTSGFESAQYLQVLVLCWLIRTMLLSSSSARVGYYGKRWRRGNCSENFIQGPPSQPDNTTLRWLGLANPARSKSDTLAASFRAQHRGRGHHTNQRHLLSPLASVTSDASAAPSARSCISMASNSFSVKGSTRYGLRVDSWWRQRLHVVVHGSMSKHEGQKAAKTFLITGAVSYSQHL